MPGSIYPKAIEGFQLETLDDEIVLLHPTSNIIIHSNQTGALIWQLCDGQRSVEEIVELLSAAYPESRTEIEKDVPEVIQTLLARGALVVR
jgi:coenzyme PQQ biosynthesis protein PqqD